MMKLTKEQIQYIDHRLENDGIKFWDIRIEMLDHIVIDVEKKLKKENSEYEFKEIVQNSFESLGWKENFNGDGLDDVFKKTINNYSKNNRKLFLVFYKEFLGKIKNIILIVLFWLYLLAVHNNTQIIKYTVLVVLFVFSLGLIGFVIKYKIFKSTKLNSLLFFAFFPLSILNVFMYWPKIFFGYQKLSSSYLAIIIAIIIPFLAIGFSFIYKEFKSAQKIYHKLID